MASAIGCGFGPTTDTPPPRMNSLPDETWAESHSNISTVRPDPARKFSTRNAAGLCVKSQMNPTRSPEPRFV